MRLKGPFHTGGGSVISSDEGQLLAVARGPDAARAIVQALNEWWDGSGGEFYNEDEENEDVDGKPAA